YLERFPVEAAIPRAIDTRRSRAGEDDAGIDWIDRQRPDRRQVSLRAHALPRRATSPADEQPCVPAGADGARLCWMHDQCLHSAVERKRRSMTYPRAPRVGAVPDAPAGSTETDAVVGRHRLRSSGGGQVVDERLEGGRPLVGVETACQVAQFAVDFDVARV